ncbi:hypothetical protein C8T65DRAFT_744630 [Cerioporus squamosus]|nr:hypothetical protein C8T65DRAFT_744630 [Cerioporus squamosus]
MSLSFGELARLLGTLPQLSHLALDSVTWLRFYDTYSSELIKSASLKLETLQMISTHGPPSCVATLLDAADLTVPVREITVDARNSAPRAFPLLSDLMLPDY